MKRIILILLCLTLCMSAFNLSTAEQSPTIPDLQSIISRPDQEPVLVSCAIEALKDIWREKCYNNRISEHGYLEIFHTQVTYISQEYALNPDANSLFSNVYCVVDFLFLSDYYGTAPYYMDANAYYSVVIYNDGRVEAGMQSPFRLYMAKTYLTDFSEIISSVHDCGSEYNAAFNLLDG